MPASSTSRFFALILFPCWIVPPAGADKSDTPAPPQLAALNAYFEQQVSALEGRLERDIKTKEDWFAKKDEYRRQLAEMLGLEPMPPRTELHATKTGEFEHEGVIVEKLHYQSMPGLYVTANLYRPKGVETALPTVLYVCGHANKKKDGISYGNKTGYEHHGMWYAQHGFVCLVIDTLGLGEIVGEHHGTYHRGRFWWWSRGYTPAGVEAWAGIRALDYLETRKEVDKTRFGVTGRSGGGAYSWWVAALDERIKAAAPTAGITTLRNHVVDGCVEGHCDCMFMVNTYRWDYDKVAALVAPRALCIVNTDKDSIFPIDGVFKIYQSVRRIYKLLGAEKNIGLQIAEGPHADTQPLNTGEFHWMTRFLQGAELMSTLDSPAVHSIPMEKLRVFGSSTGVPPVGVTGVPPVTSAPVSGETPKSPTAGTAVLPSDERNTKIDETFVPRAVEAKVPENGDEWAKQRDGWMKVIREKCFAGWSKIPNLDISPRSGEQDKIEGVELVLVQPGIAIGKSIPKHVEHREFAGGGSVDVYKGWGRVLTDSEHRIWIARRAGLEDPELIALNVLDEQGWREFASTYAHKFPKLFPEGMKVAPDDEAFEQEKKLFENFKWGMAYVCPRGIGPTAWDGDRSAGLQPAANDGGGLKARAPVDAKAAAAAEKARVQRLRRFYLLGQTLEGQQVWDVRCAIRALRSIEGLKDTKLWLQASRTQASNALMASLFEDNIARLDLHELPHSLQSSIRLQSDTAFPVPANAGDYFQPPAYLNMLRFLDLPQAAAMAAERTRVVIYDDDKSAWNYPGQVSEKLAWGKDKKNGLQLRDVPKQP